MWVSDWVCLASEPVVRPSPDLPDRPNRAKRSKTPGTERRDGGCWGVGECRWDVTAEGNDAASAVVRHDKCSLRCVLVCQSRRLLLFAPGVLLMNDAFEEQESVFS